MKIKTMLKWIVIISSFFIAASLFFSGEILSYVIVIMAEYGFMGVFLACIFSEMTPFPVGPEMVFAAGKIVELGIGKVTLMLLSVSFIGSFVNLYIGRNFYQKVCKEDRCNKVVKVYDKYGKFGLILSALGPVPYVPFCWVSGAFGISVRDFVYYAIVPRFVRLSFVAVLIFRYVRPIL